MPSIQAELKSNKQKGSFSIGYSMGMTLRKQVGTENLDAAAFLQGMQESLAGQKATLSAIEQEKALKVLVGELQKQQMKKTVEAAETNKKKGDDFLAANKANKGSPLSRAACNIASFARGTAKHPRPATRSRCTTTARSSTAPSSIARSTAANR